MQNALTGAVDAPATLTGTPERHPASTGTDARRKAQLKTFQMHPGTLKIKTLTTLYKDHVSQDQKDEDGFWTATVTEEGCHCFLFHKDDPEPSYFEPACGWKAALLPVFTNKLGMK
eukprot:g1705.t1